MKVVKWIVGIFFIMTAFGFLLSGDILTTLFMGILGIVIIPIVSEKIKSKLTLWQNRIVRYVSYFALIVLASVFMDETKTNQSLDMLHEDKTEISSKPKKNKVRYIDLDKVLFDGNGNEVKADENDVTYKVIEVLKHNKNEGRVKKANNEVISLLVEVSNHEEKNLKEITKRLKKEYAEFAPDNCFLDLWDDKKSYKLYLEREDYITKSFDKLLKEFQRTRIPFGDKHEKLKKEWDKKNYPFIADHNIASSDFSGSFTYFPLKDDYYEEVGGKNFKK